MNANDAIKLAMFSGEIMLKNGAETYRVEDTVSRVMAAVGYSNSDTFVTTTGIFLSLEGNGEIITKVVRVKTRTINLEKIALVNDFSRMMCAGRIKPEEAFEKLNEINATKPNSTISIVIAGSITCFCFCFMFGGGLLDCLNAGLIGFILQMFTSFLVRKNVSGFLVNLLGGAVISIFTLLFIQLGIGINMDKIIIGSIMPLVPGVGITNAIRDVLEGDYTSGTSRIVDAVMVAISIATGVGAVLKIWLYFDSMLAMVQ